MQPEQIAEALELPLDTILHCAELPAKLPADEATQ
jgi:hypothetical protein